MVTWIYGESGAGKSTLARQIVGDGVLLDADDVRQVWPELKWDEADRRTNNLRIAKLAHIFDRQGHAVVVATICPYEDLREQVQRITGCRFIHVEAGEGDKKSW